MDRLIRTHLFDRAQRQRGQLDMSPETAVISLGFVLVITVMIGLGQLAHTTNRLHAAADIAAREVSLLRDAGNAHTAGHDAALRAIDAHGVRCHTASITVDASGLRVSLGEVGVVSVAISCTILLTPGLVEWMPAAVTVTSTGTSPVDPYRERR